MAVETLLPQPLRADTAPACARSLERLARVTGTDRITVADAVASEATDLLDCDAAFVLAPAGRHDAARVEGVAPRGRSYATSGRRPDVGELWEVGPAARELFERPCHAGGRRPGADGRREGWAPLHFRLAGMALRSWASVPLGDPGGSQGAEARSALLVASRCAEAACGRTDLLLPLGTSAALAICGARGETAEPGEVEVLERMRALGNLSFGVSHALGNIFGAMLGNLHFLGDTITDPAAEDLLRRLERSTTEGIELMRALQVFSELPARRAMDYLDLTELARDVVEPARALCAPWPGLRDIELRSVLAPRCPAWGDAAQLRDSLVSIIFNAVQAVGGHGRITVNTEVEGESGLVSVRDDGPGMTAEVTRRATEPFFTTRLAPHQGLGLAVARGVAVAHRGNVRIVRPPEGGALVTLSIPQDPPEVVRSERLVARALSAVDLDAKGEGR